MPGKTWSKLRKQTVAANQRAVSTCNTRGKVKTNGRCVWKTAAQPKNCRSGIKYAAGPQRGRCVASKTRVLGPFDGNCFQCVGTLKSDGRSRCMKCGKIKRGAAAYAKTKNRPVAKLPPPPNGPGGNTARFCWQHAYQSQAQPPGTGARKAAARLRREKVPYLTTTNSYRDSIGAPRQQAAAGYRR
jgi:hypothetical protein